MQKRETFLYYPGELQKLVEEGVPYTLFECKTYTYKVKKEDSKTDVNKKRQADKEETFEVEEAATKLENAPEGIQHIKKIFLPIPNNLADSISGELREIGDLELARDVINTGMNLINAADMGARWDAIKNLFSGSGSRFIKRKIGQSIMEMIGLNDVSVTTSGKLGIANPYDGMLYAGHERRDFSGMFQYNSLQPENKEEEKTLNQIVNLFRSQSIGTYGDVITPPCSWNIHFFIGQFEFFILENLVITKCDVNFSGGNENRFNFSETGNPMLGFSLDFKELNRLTGSSQGLKIPYKE